MDKSINVARSSMPPYEEYCQEIRELWDSRWLTHMGVKHQKLQKELAQYLGVDGFDLLLNGHMAIELSLQALALKGEVITTPFTFASTTQAIVRSGLTPVFCDIDPVTFNIDPAKIEGLITSRTCAIVPVHVYGNVCDVEKISQIAQRHGLKVIYDAAHAFGVRYKDRGIGAYGDAVCFSFHATKVFHTVEGGGVCFHDKAFGERLAQLKYYGYGSGGLEAVEEIGTNAKMDEFRAAMGLCNLRYVDGEIKKRTQAAARYRERLEGVTGIQLNPVQEDVHPNHAYFPVIFHEDEFGADRDQVLEALQLQGIMARKYFYPLTSTFPCYKGKYDATLTPTALGFSRRVLTLPLYADLTVSEVDRVCDVVLSCQK